MENVIWIMNSALHLRILTTIPTNTSSYVILESISFQEENLCLQFVKRILKKKLIQDIARIQ